MTVNDGPVVAETGLPHAAPPSPGSAAVALFPAFVLVAINLVDGMEASMVAGALPLLQAEWGFSDTLGGALPTAAAVSGLVVALPAGYIADRYRRTRFLAVVVASWALLSTASALATGFWMFFAIRVVLGSANSLDNPSASSLVTDWYPASHRSRVFAVQRAAWTVGASLGVGLGGVLGEALGWQAPFLVVAVPGAIVAWLCWRLREPARGGMDRVPEPDPVAARGFRADLAALWRVPTLRAVYTGTGLAYLGFNGVAYWLPTFWQRDGGLGEGTAAALTGVVGLVATIVGSVGGGVVGDRRGARQAAARVVIAGGGLSGGGALFIVGLATSNVALQAILLAAGGACIVSAAPNFAAIIADVLPPARRGLGYAAFTFVIVSGGAIGPLVIGALSDAIGSLQWAFVTGLVPVAPGGLLVIRAHRGMGADIRRASPVEDR